MVIFHSYVSLPEGMTSISSMKLLVRQYALVVAVAVATVVFCQSEVQRFMFDLCWLVLFFGGQSWRQYRHDYIIMYIYTIVLVMMIHQLYCHYIYIYIIIYTVSRWSWSHSQIWEDTDPSARHMPDRWLHSVLAAVHDFPRWLRCAVG